MQFSNPVVVFLAEKNIEACMVVEMLNSKGIEAFADEDQSGVSLWSMGTIGQFHRPQVWVDSIDLASATVFVKDFEAKKYQRQNPKTSNQTVSATCEKCGWESKFSAALAGRVQSCLKCGDFVDVEPGEGECVTDQAD